ncbi:hypothetical protein BH18ACT2_BH18ACT2_18000 [soil metagenome]
MVSSRQRSAGLAAWVVLIALAGCGGGSGTPAAGSRLLAPDVTDVTAMVALPDGSVRVGLRASGEIRDVSATGAVGPPVADVGVRTDGQRGLLGVAVDADGRTFAAWIRPDGRLVVGQVAPGATRLVWEGPPSTDISNGGHLASRDGRLVIGVGDLLRNELIDDLTAINGKLVSLDPEGPPDQQPQPVSAGWNNPFAFTVVDDGTIWVADNAPGDTGERLMRGDADSGDGVELPAGTAPAGIDHLGADQLVVCGFKSGALLRYRIVDSRPTRQEDLAGDCQTATVVRAGGDVVYAAADGLRVVTP